MHKPKSPYFVAAVTAKKYQSIAGPEGTSNAFSFSIEFALLLRIGGKFIGETKLKQVTGISDAYGFKLLCGWDR